MTNPESSMKAKAREWWDSSDNQDVRRFKWDELYGRERQLVAILMYKVHREGMEEAAKVADEHLGHFAHGNECARLIAAAIRDKIDGKSTVVKNGN